MITVCPELFADFVNFGMAYLTLFRVATGDNWNGIMKASSTKRKFGNAMRNILTVWND